MKIKHEMDIQIPKTPNFILVSHTPGSSSGPMDSDTPRSISIADLTDEQLEAIADEWKVNLLNSASMKRNAPTPR